MGLGACKVQQKRMQEGVREEAAGYTGEANGKGQMRFVTFLARSLTGWAGLGFQGCVAQGRKSRRNLPSEGATCKWTFSRITRVATANPLLTYTLSLTLTLLQELARSPSLLFDKVRTYMPRCTERCSRESWKPTSTSSLPLLPPSLIAGDTTVQYLYQIW